MDTKKENLNEDLIQILVYCVRSPVALNVIPGLTKLAPCLTRGDPMISTGFLPRLRRGELLQE